MLATTFGAITGSLIGPSFDAFIAEHSDEANRGRIFAVTQTIFSIVGVIGPVLGGWLVDKRDFKFMLLIAAAFYIVATLIRVGMAREAAKRYRITAQEVDLCRTENQPRFDVRPADGWRRGDLDFAHRWDPRHLVFAVVRLHAHLHA